MFPLRNLKPMKHSGTADYINGNMEKVSTNFRKSIEILRDMEDVPGENIAMKLINAIYEE